LSSLVDQLTKKTYTVPWLHDGISPFIEVIESQASPVYPLKTTLSPGHKFSWLGQNEVFQKWRNHRGTYFLHIHGSLGISEVAEYAFQELEAGRDETLFNAILYFKFDRHDIRRNSIGAMANTFLSQIFSQCRESPAGLIEDLEPPDFRQCWTDKDAFFFLNKITAGLGNTGQVKWILDGLDQCDESSQWFLSEILGIAARSEQYFKVLITSFDDKYIREALSGFPAINLREHVKMTDPAKGNLSGPDFALMSEVLQDRPQFCQIESEIRDLLNSCGDDDQLRRLLLEWLQVTRSVTTKRAMEQEIRMLSPPSPKKVFDRILETVTEDRRRWARKVIMWVLRSVRPLTPEELGMALMLDEASEESTLQPIAHLDILWEINECFGPLFVVENGEVQLGHPSAWGVFSPENAPLEDDRPWYVLDAPEESHRKIVEFCLRYLALPSVKAQMVAACKASPNTQPILEGQSDLLSYAIQFWPHHYQLGYSTVPAVQATEIVSNFLHDRKALQYWAAANWYFSNPYIRSDRAFLSPLPIVASLGLKKLVVDLIKGQEPERDKLVAMALTEAARHGQRAVVQTLMKASNIDQSGYLEAIVAAARSGEFDTLGDLLNHATTEFKEIQWPNMLTSRVAFFGLDDMLKSLIKAGTDANPPAESDYSPPLHCAVMRNNIATVDILLEHGANPAVPNTNWKNSAPILVAAKFGHAAMVKRLVKAGASVEDHDSTQKTALWWATLLGQHEALQALVDAGADKRSADETLTEELDWPIIISAARGAFSKCLRSLLRYGANPNTRASKSYPTNALGWAAFEGNADICRLLLENGADLEGSDDDRPIIHAVRSRKREVLDVFLEKGANVDAIMETNDRADTPLIAAAELNLMDLASLLLEKGANPNCALQSGATALFYAIPSGYADMTKLLIDAGADITKTAYENKWVPLHSAYGQAECIKVLLDAGADIDATCRDGTVLYLATYLDHPEEVKLLVSRHANLEIRCQESGYRDDGYTPLHAAALQGSTEILRTLLKGGANARAKTPEDATPLILAASESKEECLKAILEYNPDLEAVDKDGNTALLCVSSTTPLSIVKLLVNRGANLEHRDRQGYTVLGRAVVNKTVPVVEYLIEKKANINVVGGYRGGPLHIAASAGNIDMLKLLVEKGGDVNLADPNISGTPLQIAFYSHSDVNDKSTMIRYLVEEASADVNTHGGYFGSALNVSFLRGSLDMIKLILDKGADVDWADNFGRRPIHYSSFKTLDHVQLLLYSGADVTAKNKLGQTPLHIAVVTGRVDVVELILSRTKNYINEPDHDGWTPLLWACRLCNRWDTASNIEASVIKLLLSHGADLWVRGQSWDQEWSPLKLAMYHGASDEVVKLLTPKIKKRVSKKGEEEVWDPKFHASHRASRTLAYCDVCLFVSIPRPTINVLGDFSY
jgi:ankyrin repeat protein